MSSSMWDLIHAQLFRAMDVVEEEIVPNVLERTNLVSELEVRFRRGDEQHGGEWQDWEPDKFIENIREEIYDAVLYCAMDFVRREAARKYGDNHASYNEATLLSCEEKQTGIGGAG